MSKAREQFNSWASKRESVFKDLISKSILENNVPFSYSGVNGLKGLDVNGIVKDEACHLDITRLDVISKWLLNNPPRWKLTPPEGIEASEVERIVKVLQEQLETGRCIELPLGWKCELMKMPKITFKDAVQSIEPLSVKGAEELRDRYFKHFPWVEEKFLSPEAREQLESRNDRISREEYEKNVLGKWEPQ